MTDAARNPGGEDDTTVAVMRVTNSRSHTVTFILEPWASEAPMPPGTTYIVIARGPAAAGTLEVEIGDDHLTVSGWGGSVAKVFHGEVEIIDAWLPCPEYSEGDLLAWARQVFSLQDRQ